MNKVKKFEISVVDRTYSKIISNLVKFYSSDSALEVIFILAEEGYEFDSAELVLSNTDGSLITRPLTKVPEGYSYEFEKNIISHHGEWKGQVILHSTNDTYISSKVVITIEDDLLSERPPKLTDVYSWTILKRYADDLVEELKQAVLSVEGIDDTFKENEAIRQTTFETAESERDETFNTNEDIRQTQELEREKAESTRQTVFEDNEASRFETFNANEVTRKANEEARELAENERENAEAQREVDHANRSAELAGKANKKQEDWITVPLYNGVQHGQSPLKVMKDEMGVVHFKGSLTNLVSSGKVFTVPIEYRPDISVTEIFIRVPISTNSPQETRTLHINYLGDGYTSNTSNTVVSHFDSVSYVAKRGL